MSVRVASSAENSTSDVNDFPGAPPRRHLRGLRRGSCASLCCMCRSEVGRRVEPGAGGDLDSPPGLLDVVPVVRASAAITGRRTRAPRRALARKSSSLAIGKPASMDVHPRRSSWRAIRTLSSSSCCSSGDALRRAASCRKSRFGRARCLLDSEVSVHIRGGMPGCQPDSARSILRVPHRATEAIRGVSGSTSHTPMRD